MVFGDAARLQSLMAAGLARASAVVVSYQDTASALKILRLVQEHAPKVPVIVRTIDDSEMEKLRAAGATEVVPEAIEGSLMLASHALALVGVPMRRVIRVVQDQRDARYGLLRGYFHGADDDTADDRNQARLNTVPLPVAAACVGQPLGDQALHAIGVQVVSVRVCVTDGIDTRDIGHQQLFGQFKGQRVIFAGGIEQQRAQERRPFEHGDDATGKKMHGAQVGQPLGILIEHAQDALRAPDGYLGQRHAANLLDPAIFGGDWVAVRIEFGSP